MHAFVAESSCSHPARARPSPSFRPRSYPSLSRCSPLTLAGPCSFHATGPLPPLLSPFVATYRNGSLCEPTSCATGRSDDIRLLLFALQNHLPFSFQAPGNRDHFLLRCVHFTRANRPQRLHVFFEH